MSVRVYDEEHPRADGWVGCVVARMVDGVLRQKTFSLRRKRAPLPPKEAEQVRRKAFALDADWEREQLAVRREKSESLEPQSEDAAVPVRHIHLQRGETAGRGRDYPFFEVALKSETDRSPVRRFYFHKLGYEKAWAEAVACLARDRGLRDSKYLLALIPPRPSWLKKKQPPVRARTSEVRNIWLDRGPRSGRRYPRANFSVQVTGGAVKSPVRRFYFHTLGYEQAWADGIAYLAEVTGLDNRRELLAKIPPRPPWVDEALAYRSKKAGKRHA